DAAADGVPGAPAPSGGVRDVPARLLEDLRELALARLRRPRGRHIAAGIVRQLDVRPREQRVIAEQHRALDDVGQLAHVPPPRLARPDLPALPPQPPPPHALI